MIVANGPLNDLQEWRALCFVTRNEAFETLSGRFLACGRGLPRLYWTHTYPQIEKYAHTTSASDVRAE
jgi:hypothetical protein